MTRLIVLLLLLTAACGSLGLGGASMTDCERVGVRLTLPAYAANVDEHCTAGTGPGNAAYRATFTIPAAQLTAFQQSTGLSTWDTNGANALIFEDEAAELDAVLLASASNGATMREVLIDMRDAQTYRVSYYDAFVD